MTLAMSCVDMLGLCSTAPILEAFTCPFARPAHPNFVLARMSTFPAVWQASTLLRSMLTHPQAHATAAPPPHPHWEASRTKHPLCPHMNQPAYASPHPHRNCYQCQVRSVCLVGCLICHCCHRGAASASWPSIWPHLQHVVSPCPLGCASSAV